jgi:hypothetical protein
MDEDEELEGRADRIFGDASASSGSQHAHELMH